MARTRSSRAPKKKKRTRTQPRSRFQRFLFRYGWLLPVGAILIGGGILLLTYAFASIPLPQDIRLTASAKVFDRNGTLIGTFQDEVRRFIIDTDKLPSHIADAVIAAEDRDFYDHNGVSLRGIARAAWANLTGGEIQQGGSTITQQYIKQAVLQDTERTVTRKVKEAILAIKLERRYSKDEILGFYLNTIYLGRGAYGIEAAAGTYFGKHARELTLGETAYLAGIIPAPERYQLDRARPAATARRDRVLDLMVEEGYIEASEAAAAKRKKLKLTKSATRDVNPQTAAYFLEWLRKEFLYPEYGERLFTDGLRIYTTLDLGMQEQAQVAIDGVLTLPTDPQAALVTMTPQGEVRAFVGGRDYTDLQKARGFNYASDNPGRHAGSAFKPFTLLAAIEEGISLSSSFSGASPRTITEEECSTNGEPWEVDNFGGSSYGTMDLRSATTNSVNTVYAQLMAEIGASKVGKLLERFEFAQATDSDFVPTCSLTLGTLPVTPVEMARAYAGLAAGGRLPEVMPIRYIENREGCIKRYRPGAAECDEEIDELETEQLVDRNSAYLLTDALTGPVEGGTATVANIAPYVAGKTGTTQNQRDAWFAGYTPQLATVVWEGYPLNRDKKRTCDIPDFEYCPHKVNYVPRMEYCSDTDVCRPVHGVEVTGGCSTVCPAKIWADYMSVVTAELEPVPFPTPTATPTEIINSPPPAPVAPPSPTESEEPSPEPSETVEPTVEPTPTPEPTPTTQPSPSPLITPTPPREEEDP